MGTKIQCDEFDICDFRHASPPIKINVIDMLGSNPAINGLYPDSMIGELKQVYYLGRDIPIDNQMLFFHGDPLRNHEKLSTYGVEHDSTVMFREVRMCKNAKKVIQNVPKESLHSLPVE